MTDPASGLFRYPKLEGHFETHRAVAGLVNAQPALVPLFYDVWWSARNHVPMRPTEPDGQSGAGGTDSIDVLFLPLRRQNNFLGAAQVTADALFRFSSFVRTAFLSSSECPLTEADVGVHGLVSWADLPADDDDGGTSADITTFCDRIAGHPLLSTLVTRDELEQRQREHLRAISGARAFLRERGIKAVVAPNEFLPVSATFLAASKLEGIPFLQMLHSIPERFYVPFFGDEFWVWNETMRDAFIGYGADAASVWVVGNLELAYQKAQPRPEGQDLDVPKPHVVLFCLQDIKKPYNLRDLEIVRDAFATLPDDWCLRIRIKPGHDSDDTFNVIHSWFGGFDGRVMMTCNRPLWNDLIDADVVCGGHTSASYISLGLGYPLALLWNSDIQITRGEAMANPARVCENADRLSVLLNDPSLIPPLGPLDLKHPDDAPYVAASRIMARLMHAGY
ncbi:MAG: hypothetical protein RIC16_03600 [Rhodospirillales bacterium]